MQAARVTTVDHGESCGRRPARGRHCDLPALRTLAPAPLLMLVLLLVLAAASRLFSPCCASWQHMLVRRVCKNDEAGRFSWCCCSRTSELMQLADSCKKSRSEWPN